ncbi:MAG: DUF4838 domain-containing protein [Lentisphaerae bacterium]|jgi:hypothetical protein|nr:DUF4838 domain-containing protein [Lentisphaerota bacterium]MBT4815234.1 DUF4838 domain-containing protein [Lentisphaerota bacterium]MBT5605160.1 DUF4838 domain-containing protein [Lentisphaerota bacterium]MBT7058846.1 DUF4838 domain-containing protein [Lentisphaerota bacterium]MBT7842323.1 DUF4838 domain-containing protein [Lentisphaerota bacterium]
MLKHRALASICVSGLMSSALFGQGDGGEFALIRNGTAVARIVLSATPHAMERQAADELNLYVHKSTGVTLPVSSDAQGGVPAILIGAHAEKLRTTLQLESLAFGGFVIDSSARRLVLAGNVPEGTLNAVYAFLEDVVGVRWYVPTELGENVPKQPTLAIPAGQRRVEPRFVNRKNHGIDLSIRGDGATWRRRNRITSHSLDVPFNRYSHWLYKVFPASKYGKTHPEYFPILKGKRFVPEKDHEQGWQPCTTEPDVVRLTIEAARRWFDEHPRSNFFSVGMNDSGAFCECKRCLAMDLPGAEFRGRKMVSDRYFTFVKQVADAIAVSHPDKYISCIAYSVVEELPRQVEIPKNVMVVITQDVAQWFDPAYKATDVEFATAWSKAAGVFGTYDYTGLTWIMPRVYPHLMAESLRFYDRVGAVAATNEAFPSWWYAGPLMYLRGKLMWDPKQDPDVVLSEFYTGFFGPGAEAMRAFYDVLERCTTKPREGRWFEGLGCALQQMALWEEADLDDCRRALDKGRAAVPGPGLYADRFAFVERGFRFMEALLEEYWQARQISQLAVSPDTPPEELLSGLRELLRLTQVRESVWQEVREDRLVSGIYRLLFTQFSSRLGTWRSYLESSVTMGVSALATRPDIGLDRVRSVLPELADRGVAADVAALLWARENPDASNLCENAGFEDERGGGGPEGVDWVSTNAPPTWAAWSLKPENRVRMTWERDGGRGGSRCVRMKGMGDACFIQTQAGQAGERYVASVWTRVTGAETGRARLVVQWKDADGAWVWSEPRREASVTAGKGDWRQLSLAFTIPKGVHQAVVLLCAKDQGEGDTVWFDDVRLVRTPGDGRQ